MATSGRGPRAIPVALSAGTVTVYAGVRIARALEELTDDMSLYHGVRLAQVVEAVYQQGVRDGRRQVIEAFGDLAETPELQYRNPGRPAKKTAAKKTAAKKTAAKKTAAKKTAG